MQARCNAARQISVATSAVENEAELHTQILDYCSSKGWIAFHGNMARATGRTLGEPDFEILIDGGRFLLIECKTKTGKLSVEQQGMILWAEKLGHKIHVVRSMEEFVCLAK
jgi:hypothetical protein